MKVGDVVLLHPGKLFTAHDSLVAKTVPRLTDVVKDEVREAVSRIIGGK